MTTYTVDNPYLAVTLMQLGFPMAKKGIFEDSEDLKRAVNKYKKRGITVDLKEFYEHLMYFNSL